MLSRKQWVKPEYPLNIPILLDEDTPPPRQYPSIWRLKTRKIIYKCNTNPNLNPIRTKKLKHNDLVKFTELAELAELVDSDCN